MFNDSSIIFRITSFLRNLYPFRYFTEEDLQQLSNESIISVLVENATIFTKRSEPTSYFYIVKKGAVEIFDPQNDNQKVIIDRCGEGDMFGIRPILANSPYLYSAITSEETILYQIPIEIFKATYHKYPSALDYMIQRFAAGRSIREQNLESDNSIQEIIEPSRLTPIQLAKDLISTSPDISIFAAIEKMHQHNVSSIVIIDNENYPIGIITDKDIRSSVAKKLNLQYEVTTIMSQPVECIAQDDYVEDVQLFMIKKGVHHLCVTKDGTNQSKALGMFTEHDLLYSSSNSPVVIMKKIKKAYTVEQLIEVRQKLDRLLPIYLDKQISLELSLKIIDTLNSSIIQKAVDISLIEYNKTSVESINASDFAFFIMGSAARSEQLHMTDQDNGLVISDSCNIDFENFLNFGKIITEKLQQIGYAFCPANMMASNPNWCLKLKQYKEKAQSWILNPGPGEVLNTSIFFDFRHEYGNADLSSELKEFIKDLLNKQDIYIRFLAKPACSNPPPLSFFRKMIVEKDGKYRDLFDIKLRAIAPITDMARVMALDECYVESSSTVDRLKFISRQDIGNLGLYNDLIESYVFLLKTRYFFTHENKENSRYIDPSELDKLSKLKLRKAFNQIKKLQDLLERKYKLGFI